MPSQKNSRDETKRDNLGANENNAHAEEQIKELQKRIEILSKDTIFLKGGMSVIAIVFSALSIVFIIASIAGLSRVFQYDNLKASSDGINRLLVKQIEVQTGRAINQFNVTMSSDQEKEDLEKLNNLIHVMDDLKFRDDNFEGIKELVGVINLIVQEEKLDEASKLTTKICNKYSGDRFIASRAKTLSVLISIARDRNNPQTEQMRTDLTDAIKMDNTNAGAFNSLGILITNQAREKLKTKDFEEARKMIKQANLNFEIASSLNQTSTGKLKYINNKIWNSLTLFREILVNEGPESTKISDLLGDLNYVSANDFFEMSCKEIEIYEETTTFPIAPETLAQLKFVEAEFLRAKHDPLNKVTDLKRADVVEKEGAEKFVKAIKKGLYKRVTSKSEAIRQFDEDFLHQYFIQTKPALAEFIRQNIRDFTPNDQ